MYEIQLAKDSFKFACSHFTILGADRAERLHGHNYYVRVDVAFDQIDPTLGFAFDYNAVKPLIRAFCESLDERILIPLRSPHLRVATTETQVTAEFGRKHYAFPAEDVVRLEVSNVTCEELARLGAETLRRAMTDLPHWTQLRVHVEETRGQSCSFTLRR